MFLFCLPGFILPSVTSGFRDALTFLDVFSIRKQGIVQSWAVQICTWNTIHILKSSCLSPSTLSPPLLWLTHLHINKASFSISVSPKHKQYKRSSHLCGGHAKNKNLCNFTACWKGPTFAFSKSSLGGLAQHLWGTHQSNNNEGGFG